MKTIEVDEELYRYIASHTQHIGESASDILRRMLKFTAGQPVRALPAASAPQSGELEKRRRRSVRAIACAPCASCCCRMNMPSRTKRSTVSCWCCPRCIPSMPPVFAAATEALTSRTRTYFAGDQQTLLANGTHTKPKHVPGTLLGDHQYQYRPQTQHDRTHHAGHAVPGGTDRESLRYRLI